MTVKTKSFGNAYSWWVVVVLTITYMIALVDRQILSLMVDPIRADLNLSDTQISLLHGFAFALFYTSFGVLLGWAADLWNRRNLIFFGLAVWGLSTVASGLAVSFAGLFLARMIVGMGEATLSPAAYSMIYDYFDSSKRGRAMSVYGIGVVLGAGAAYMLGGAVLEFGDDLAGWLTFLPDHLITPWRVTFIVVGSLSLIALLLIATIREPDRKKSETKDKWTEKSNPFACTGYIWENKLYLGRIITGVGIGSIIFNGIFAWVPSHFIRVFGWAASEIGLGFGLVLIVFGPLGMLLSGFWSDRMVAAGKPDGPAKVVFLGETFGGIGAILFGFAPNPELALAALSLCVFSFSSALAVAPVALQAVTPHTLRSQMIAFYLLVANVLGLGIGPTLIAGVSDFILGNEQRIGMAVSLVAMLVAPITAYLLFGAWRWRCRSEAENPTGAA